MSDALDFDAIKARHSLSEIVGRYVEWDKKKTVQARGEWWACCPFHSERTPSFHVTDSKRSFKCFGCGASGDLFDFLKAVEGKGARDVARMLEGDFKPSTKPFEKIKKPEQTYVVTRPGSERIYPGEKLTLWNPKRQQWNTTTPSMVFPYNDASGELIGYVIRIDIEGGGKLTPQVMWVVKNDGEMCWAYAPFLSPKPMYGLDRLHADGMVWLVEGEKKADALHRIIGGSVLGWPGGVDGVKHVDWKPLDGRDVTMWRDNDGPGLRAAETIRGICEARSFKIVGGEVERSEGWDAADAEIEGWDAARVHAWADEWDGDPPPDSIAEAYPELAIKPVKNLSDAPYRVLGYNRETYFYLPNGKQQVVELRASEHTSLRLLQLAPLTHWETLFDGEAVTDKGWQQIANGLIQQAHSEGIFEENRLRGRGAWIDGSRVVVHTGSEAVIGKDVVPLSQVKSHYIYEAQPPWEFGFGAPASNKSAHRLVEVCERLTWSDKLSAALLAGWCVIAPVSGALTWRPHIWVTGPSGSGKTTAINDIVGRIVGPSAQRFDGKTTEAAIRQMMGRDARPVIFDEAEGEDQAGAARMQAILDLARAASSGAVTVKGGNNHKPVLFIVRACFCFSSINTAVRHQADESRISRLVLTPNTASNREQHFNDLMRDIMEWFTPEYASTMFARTVNHLPTLLKNAETFTAAAAAAFHSRRAADQIGPMLAGYYLCHSIGDVSFQRATEFIEEHEWGDYLALDAESDELRLLRYLMSRPVRVEMATGSRTVSVGQAIMESRLEAGDRSKPYLSALGPRGIRVEDGMIAIANNADGLRDLFKEQPQWSADWKRPVSMIPGAQKSSGAVYFAPGVTQRATWVPIGHLDGTYKERQPGEDGE